MNIKFLDDTREIIRHHHERNDGSGYPDGLKEDEISMGARIVAVADTFDAMNSDRPYRKKIPYEVIKKELLSLRGTKLDAQCLNALFDYLEKSKNPDI